MIKTFVLICILYGYGPTLSMTATPGYDEIGCNMAATDFMNTLRDNKMNAIPYAYCIKGPSMKDN